MKSHCTSHSDTEGTASATPHWVGKEYSFFQHTACEYFPCHQTAQPQSFNCLFCYCPLYSLGPRCDGNFTYTEQGIKDCSRCTIPHQKENYGLILSQMEQLQALAGPESKGTNCPP